MRYKILAGASIVAIAVAGCGSSKIAQTKEVKQDTAKVEAIVQACIKKGGGKNAIIKCIAPPGHEAALESCALEVFAHDAILHHTRIPTDLAKCVEKNR